MLSIKWQCKQFDQLSVAELYNILQLRAAIFVVEQNCVYQDMDGKDLQAYHVMAWKSNVLVAHTRLLPAGISFHELSIGRVVVRQSERGSGLGKELMRYSMQQSYQLFGYIPIKIGAQLYLKKFYESLGFRQCGEVYKEDGIDHIQMLLPIAN